MRIYEYAYKLTYVYTSMLYIYICMYIYIYAVMVFREIASNNKTHQLSHFYIYTSSTYI
jgi:hypothetical protein